MLCVDLATNLNTWVYSHQTPVYALYQIPTIVCAAILLATRHLNIHLPSQPPVCWWELFDARWEDVWSISGYIMRLYRQRTPEESRRVLGMVNKQEVRKWLENNQLTVSESWRWAFVEMIYLLIQVFFYIFVYFAIKAMEDHFRSPRRIIRLSLHLYMYLSRA